MNRGPTPPPVWRWLLRRVLPVRDRSVLLAELDDGFARRVASLGLGAARRWYREEVLAFVMRVPDRPARRATMGMGEWSMGGFRECAIVLRGLRRSPGFAALATFTLALGISASAIVFAIADRALLRPLPFPDPDRLVSVMEGWGTSLGSLEILQREMTTVVAIGGAWDAVGTTLIPDQGPARRVSAARVSPEYLEALGVQPAIGRTFRREESGPGLDRVVILSADFHTREFGGASEALGATLLLDGERYEVVGVMPPGFDLPSDRNDMWIPATMDASPDNVGMHWGLGAFILVARMNDDATPDDVKAELLSVQGQVRVANPLWTPPEGFWNDAVVATLRDARGRSTRTPLLFLFGAVAIVLVVVCANVANLILSRSVARRRDLAVRVALGAGRGRLVSGQVVEVTTLSIAGAALGLALATLGLEVLRPLMPLDVPGAASAAIDLRVIGFAAALSLLVALVAGMGPALQLGRRAPGAFLRESGRGRSQSPGGRRTTAVLVGAQMCAAVVLITTAGLLGRSLRGMATVDPGFEAAGRVTARLDLPPGLPATREARALRWEEVEEALGGDPAIRDVALASSIPFGSVWESMAVVIPGVTDDPNDLPVVQQRRVSASFFDVMNIPLRAGRGFDVGDRVETAPVAIVDQEFAARFFPGEDPVGRTVRYPWRGAPDIEVVGVAGATRDVDLSEEMAPTVYFPIAQASGGSIANATVVARASSDPGAALAAVRTRALAFDDRMPVSETASYEDLLRESLAGPRLLTLLLVVFAGSTLVLGCIGVYGVASLAARRRVREIGVRMTLGADPSEIHASFLREGLLLALPGGVIGLVAAALGGRLLSSLLYGVSPLDPVTFAAVPVILVASALIAVYVPARRATRVDPATVLRAE